MNLKLAGQRIRTWRYILLILSFLFLGGVGYWGANVLVTSWRFIGVTNYLTIAWGAAKILIPILFVVSCIWFLFVPHVDLRRKTQSQNIKQGEP